MKNIKWLAAGLLLVSTLPTQAAQVREHTYSVGVDVDANGLITATQVDADVPANIADVLARSVKRWEFVPASRNGHPVAAHTFIRAKLQGAPDSSGQYKLRLHFIGNGPRIETTLEGPRYPQSEARANLQAFVWLDANVQPDGSLADLTVRSRVKQWPIHPAFQKAVLAAARHWHAVPEQVDGHPVTTNVLIPVDFTLSTQKLSREQAEKLRNSTAKAKMIANPNATVDPSDIPLLSNEPVALDSPLQPRAVATIENLH